MPLFKMADKISWNICGTSSFGKCYKCCSDCEVCKGAHLTTLLWSKLVTFPNYDDVIKWKHFPRYWPFVRGIHRWPVNFPHKGQWRGALIFSLICAWTNCWVNNRVAGDLRRHCTHYDVIVMIRLILLAMDQDPPRAITSHSQTEIENS